MALRLRLMFNKLSDGVEIFGGYIRVSLSDVGYSQYECYSIPGSFIVPGVTIYSQNLLGILTIFRLEIHSHFNNQA